MLYLGLYDHVKEDENSIYDGLLKRVAEKDSKALSELYGKSYKKVYAFVLSVLKNRHDAEDVTSDVYVRLFTFAGSYKGGKPMAWIFTVARNLCMEKFRNRKKQLSVEDADIFSQDAYCYSPDDRIVLEATLEKLSEEERQIVVLRAVSDLKFKEIAAITALPTATVITKYSRALAKLKKLL